mmetsp:Transcript_14372/g.24333  ORF Transcript_14372/g.24333 Transcript_14372/m.24333 type:complete len:165 (+) Transcript_14372:84-578(+)
MNTSSSRSRTRRKCPLVSQLAGSPFALPMSCPVRVTLVPHSTTGVSREGYVCLSLRPCRVPYGLYLFVACEVRPGAIVSGVDRFDAAFFTVHPQEAHCMDPQHRVLQSSVHSSLVHAGASKASLHLSAAAQSVFRFVCHHPPVSRPGLARSGGAYSHGAEAFGV